MKLDTDTELTLHGEGCYQVELSPEWNVWGMNGGYLAAVALRAAGESASWDTPAAISASFVSRPDTGTADIAVEVVRRTSKAECRSVIIGQDGTPILTATVWSAAAGRHGNEPAVRDLPAPQLVPSLLEFLNNDENALLPWQLAIEDHPLTFPEDWYARAPSEPIYEAWFRYRPQAIFASPWLNAARALVIADIYPVFGYLRATPGLELTCRAATISLSAQFHRPTDDEEYLFGDCRVTGAAHGLLGTTTSVWNTKGECCATAIQQNLLLA